MGRNIVLCFDGTNDEYSAVNTNVVPLYALVDRNRTDQLAYYQPGSRGAYAGRVLVAMLNRVGLLTAGNEELIPFAWKQYRTDDHNSGVVAIVGELVAATLYLAVRSS